MICCAPFICAVDGFQKVGSYYYFPSQAAHNDENQSSIAVNVSGNEVNYNWKMVTHGSDSSTKYSGASNVRQHGSPFYMTVNGASYPIYAIEITPTSGHLAIKSPGSGGYWTVISGSSSNEISNFQQAYIDYIAQLRGEGWPVGVDHATWQAFLYGISPAEAFTPEVNGGTPGPITPNPPGGSTTSTTTGGGTTTTTSGNSTVNQTNSNTYTYTYNYTTNNNTTNEGAEVDLSPVTTAVNAVGTKVQATNDKLDYLTTHVIDGNEAIADRLDTLIANGGGGGGGGGIPGPVAGIEPGEAPDVGTLVSDAGDAGADGAEGKLGGLAAGMALSGQSTHVMTLAIPWVDGSTREYHLSSMPEAGSPMDSFRIILRVLLGVLIALSFIVLCVKTLRFY